MSSFDVVIIGSGMGGLACGAMLSKEGMSVCVVERSGVVGGCLQSFSRRGQLFDTGIHYVGSMKSGQILNQYFKYFGVLSDLQVRMLDSSGFDRINILDCQYRHAMGFDNFAKVLANDFPHEKQGLDRYVQLLQSVGSLISPEVLRSGRLSAGGADYLALSAATAIDNFVADPILRRVLAGSAPLYAGQRDRSPLYHHAMINFSNIEGACSFVGGTQQIANSLSAVITANAGQVRTRSEATHLSLSGDRISGVEINGGEEFLEAKYVISDAPPSVTFNLLESTPLLRRAFLSRLNFLPHTYGIFSLQLHLKERSVLYQNFNQYIYNNPDVWSSEGDFEGCNIPAVLLCMQPPAVGEWAEVVNVLVPMPYHLVEPWAESRSGSRDDSYRDFKARYAATILRFIERFHPNLRDSVAHAYTSTPLTYRDYTSVPEGAAYGLQKDFNHPLTSMIPARSKISNLLLTGQNLNVHGLLGVAVSSAVTCSELLGEEYLAKKIGHA